MDDTVCVAVGEGVTVFEDFKVGVGVGVVGCTGDGFSVCVLVGVTLDVAVGCAIMTGIGVDGILDSSRVSWISPIPEGVADTII